MSSNVTESDSLLELMTWLEVNKKRLIIGAVVVAVVGSALGVYNYLHKQREFAASDALVRLGVGRDTQPTATDYAKVLDEYSGSQAAERALILAAGAFFSEGRHNDAKTKFEQYLKDYPSGLMRGIASLGVAACLDEMNKVDEAIAAYQGVASAYGTDPVVHRAKLAMALLYVTKKQPAQAVKIYEELSRTTPPTTLNSEARLLLDDLIKRHPELKPASAPVKAATTMPTLLPAGGAQQTQAAPSATGKAPAPATKPKQ
ncbi:MAG: tetratricopeptide repeat protein [Pedosphaera parvula]|nr:tetratricopeptide repeat protein [Pedosphaera parvula]